MNCMRVATIGGDELPWQTPNKWAVIKTHRVLKRSNKNPGWFLGASDFFISYWNHPNITGNSTYVFTVFTAVNDQIYQILNSQEGPKNPMGKNLTLQGRSDRHLGSQQKSRDVDSNQGLLTSISGFYVP